MSGSHRTGKLKNEDLTPYALPGEVGGSFSRLEWQAISSDPEAVFSQLSPTPRETLATKQKQKQKQKQKVSALPIHEPNGG